MNEVFMQDLSSLLKEEGQLVKELTSVSVQAAKLHARLEGLKKGIDSGEYSRRQTAELVKKAGEKYASELEGQLKQTSRLQDN